MNKRFKKYVSVFLCVLTVLMSFSIFAFATEATDVLTFTVSPDGFAEVFSCNTEAQGEVSIPESVIIGEKSYKVRYIGEKAFDSCYYITEINIPEGVTSIKSHAFRDCLSLKEIHIPRSLIMCQYDAFDGCGNVTVHCYTSNYQFFTLYGLGSNLEIDILDHEQVTPDNDADTSVSFLENFINIIREMIERILELVGANDDDFEFDLGFDLPFLN